ncbi:hypothetical protein [Trichothermofontia sp.]
MNAEATITPLVINEEVVTLFKYWQDTIQEGMRCGEELYRHFRSLDLHDRLRAYDLGWKLAQSGYPVCVTCSSQRYAVWVSLRAPQTITDNQVEEASTLLATIAA